MPNITKKNYHSKANTYISNSKAKLFVKSKEAYKKRYIDFSDDSESTKSLRIGAMVDIAFENGDIQSIRDNFQVKLKRTCLAKDNRELYDYETSIIEAQKDLDQSVLVSESEFHLASMLANKIISSDLYQWYKKPGMRRYFQKVFKNDELGICGMADVITVDSKNKVVYIDDLKTSTAKDCSSVKKWYYKCLEYGYLDQMAIYKWFVEKKYAGYNVICRHIVIDTDKYHKIKLYIIDDSLLEGRFNSFLGVVNEIKAEKEWVDRIPTWEDGVEVLSTLTVT